MKEPEEGRAGNRPYGCFLRVARAEQGISNFKQNVSSDWETDSFQSCTFEGHHSGDTCFYSLQHRKGRLVPRVR